MCRNISLPESPFAPCIFRAVYVIGDFPFLVILYQKVFQKTIGKGDKENLSELYKTEVSILIFVTYIDEWDKISYHNSVVCRAGFSPARHFHLFLVSFIPCIQTSDRTCRQCLRRARPWPPCGQKRRSHAGYGRRTCGSHSQRS